MRLFAQLSWYFRREWRRYLGAIALLAIIAVLQLIPPKVVGIVVDGVTRQHYTAEKVWMWIGALVLIAVMVYLLRYVWRVLLLAPLISWRWSYGRTLSSAQPSASGLYLRHRTGDLIARATNDVDRVVFAAGKGADAGGLYGNGLCGVDRDVNANQLAAHSAGAVADAGDGPGYQA